MKLAEHAHTKNPQVNRILTALLFAAALGFVLIVQGAIPFLTAPTLGQAIWTAGFGQSFINESLFNTYAHNFGAPAPAAISFGLAGAWPTGVFIKLGLTPIDAYTMMAGLWLTVAFSSAFAIGRHFSLSPRTAILAALAWGTMPVIWANSGYSMLSLGFALLPFYLLSSLKLFHTTSEESVPSGLALASVATFSLLACLTSVFMDGYSFVMFAVASSIVGGVTFLQNGSLRRFYLKFSIPIHILSFTIAPNKKRRYTQTSRLNTSPKRFNFSKPNSS